MSTACPIDGTTSGTVNGSSASIPIFPGEQPSYKDLRQWIERTETALSQTTFGPALRGVTPPHLIHLTIKRDSGIVELSADDKAKAGVLEIARYERDIAKARAEETIRIKQLEIGELEYKNKLAALFQASLRPNQCGPTAEEAAEAQCDPRHEHPRWHPNVEGAYQAPR